MTEDVDCLQCSERSCGSHPSPLKPDHCDLLLDAMDAQLDQLQVPSKKCELSFRADCCNDAAPHRWSLSPSKDTGLGSTRLTNDTPMSCFELLQTPPMEQISDLHMETEKNQVRRWRDEDECENHREQVMWRLERLLGDVCKERQMAAETLRPSDSILTEDYVRRFAEEMLEPTVADDDVQSQRRGEESEGTVKAPSVEKRPSNPNSADTAATDWSQLNTPVSHRLSEVIKENPTFQYNNNNNSCSSKARCLAGVPVMSFFDTVSIDSDVDTVCTEQLRQHTDQRAGWRSFLPSVTDMKDHSERDTPTCAEDEVQSGAVHRYSSRRSRRFSLHKSQPNGRETMRLVSSLSDEDDDDADEHGIYDWSRIFRTERRSDWIQMKERLLDLQHVVGVKVGELQDELVESKMRVATLEQILSTKELQLVDLQQRCGAAQTERDEQNQELQNLMTQHLVELRKAEQEVHCMTVLKQAEEEKVTTLKEETLSLAQHIESVQSSLQLKDQEIFKLKNSLQQDKEKAKEREEELKVEALDKVYKAVEEERIKWESEKVEAVRMHCGKLEERHEKLTERLKCEIQQEKSKAWDFQRKVAELTAKIEDLESQHSAQQIKQKSEWAIIYTSLREQHQRSLRHMEEQQQETELRLKQEVELLKKESDSLRSSLQEKQSNHNHSMAELEQNHRDWAQQVEAECQHLQILLQHSGHEPSVEEPHSLSAEDVLTHLKTLRGKFKLFIRRLYQQLESQRQISEHLEKNKERELQIQKQQLRTERDEAVDFIKERLIQEHIEELSHLKKVHVQDGGAQGEEGVAASLRRQLKAKDVELRQVQRSMSQWKQQTAARLARRFEEELTSELERKIPKQNKRQPAEAEMSAAAKQDSAVGPSSPHVVDSVVSYSPVDMASFRLLRHLQMRVRQLRQESHTFTWSSSDPPHTGSVDLLGSHPKSSTSQSSTRTASSEGRRTSKHQ
ncbi:spindle pole body component 110 [Gouania willdenowi]|uniref:spindle pole body component 110 n=1 Tax=Gouania willdenowi TaxID=441366 RepID=UPI001055D744|nr:spindle pole body component 110-like [Gouania willdenowi]